MPGFFQEDVKDRQALSVDAVLAYLQQDLSVEARTAYLNTLKQSLDDAELFVGANHALVTLISDQHAMLEVHKETIKQLSQKNIYELQAKGVPVSSDVSDNLHELATMMVNGERNDFYARCRRYAVTDFGEQAISALCTSADELLIVKEQVLKNIEWAEQSIRLWQELSAEKQNQFNPC